MSRDEPPEEGRVVRLHGAFGTGDGHFRDGRWWLSVEGPDTEVEVDSWEPI